MATATKRPTPTGKPTRESEQATPLEVPDEYDRTLGLWTNIFRTVSELEDIEHAFLRSICVMRSLVNIVFAESANADGHEEN